LAEQGGRLSDAAIGKAGGGEAQVTREDKTAERSAYAANNGVAECAQAQLA